MGIVVFIRIGYRRIGGYLGHLGYGGHLVSIILEIIDLSHIGSFRRTNFNARTNCGITLLYFYALGIFVSIGRFYLGERSTRYST